jgi:hypothetical protein
MALEQMFDAVRAGDMREATFRAKMISGAVAVYLADL